MIVIGIDPHKQHAYGGGREGSERASWRGAHRACSRARLRGAARVGARASTSERLCALEDCRHVSRRAGAFPAGPRRAGRARAAATDGRGAPRGTQLGQVGSRSTHVRCPCRRARARATGSAVPGRQRAGDRSCCSTTTRAGRRADTHAEAACAGTCTTGRRNARSRLARSTATAGWTGSHGCSRGAEQAAQWQIARRARRALQRTDRPGQRSWSGSWQRLIEREARAAACAQRLRRPRRGETTRRGRRRGSLRTKQAGQARRLSAAARLLGSTTAPPTEPHRQSPTQSCALHRIAVTQGRWHPPARAYLARKQAEGKSRKEALRCLKRHLTTRRLSHTASDRAGKADLDKSANNGAGLDIGETRDHSAHMAPR